MISQSLDVPNPNSGLSLVTFIRKSHTAGHGVRTKHISLEVLVNFVVTSTMAPYREYVTFRSVTVACSLSSTCAPPPPHSYSLTVPREKVTLLMHLLEW